MTASLPKLESFSSPSICGTAGVKMAASALEELWQIRAFVVVTRLMLDVVARVHGSISATIIAKLGIKFVLTHVYSKKKYWKLRVFTVIVTILEVSAAESSK